MRIIYWSSDVCSSELVTLPIERPLHEALAPILDEGNGDGALPQVKPEDDATILFTSGSTGKARGAVSTHHAVTPGTSAYAIGLETLRGILESEGSPPPPPRTTVAVPPFHLTGALTVMHTTSCVVRGGG